MKKTVVIGASPNSHRYSHIAAKRLSAAGHEIILLGNKNGFIDGQAIICDRPDLKDVDTVTIYLSPQRQTDWYDYILNLKPARIIFNPGAENAELAKLAQEHHILSENACTLVMLSTGQY